MALPRHSRRSWIVLAAGAAVATAAAGGVAWEAWRARDPSLDRVRRRGRLRVGLAPEAPYVVLGADGRPGGESPEVARDVAGALGVRPEWVLTTFDRLIPELLADRFDMIAAGLFITPARERLVRFSRPTLTVRAGWLVRAGQGAGLGTYAALARDAGSHRRIAVIAGSVEEAAFLAADLPRERLLAVPDADAGAAAVAQGAADALALSLPSVQRIAARHPQALQALPASGPGVPAAHVGLAFRPEDRALAGAVDRFLATYLGSAAHRAALHRAGMSGDAP